MFRKLITTSSTSRTSTILMKWMTSSQNPPNIDTLNNAHIPIVDYNDPEYLPLPEYPEKINEPLEQRRQRLLYQSRKRGMLENDLILSTFAAKYLNEFSPEHVAIYDKLINGPTNDWDIYYWITDNKPTPQEYESEVMTLLKDHVKNSKKEQRIRQPDLFHK